MNSEIVKEIKENLQDELFIATKFEDTLRRISTRDLQKILTLINELESETERLQKKNYQLEQDLGQCENGYKLELHTARYQMQSVNENLKKAQDRIAELEKENKDYYDRLNNLQTYIDNHEEIWKGNTNNALKQFAERLKEELKGIVGANFINETLKKMIEE